MSDFKKYVSKVYPNDTAIKENYPLDELIEMYGDLYEEFKKVASSEFDKWHFNKWKLQNAVTDTVEFAKVLYDRVYSHDHAARERSLEYSVWNERQAVIDELQGRIDAALKRANYACIGMEMFNLQFLDILRILKGYGPPKDATHYNDLAPLRTLYYKDDGEKLWLWDQKQWVLSIGKGRDLKPIV